MAELWEPFKQLVEALGQLAGGLLLLALQWSLLLAWVAWWLGAVNWRRAWPVLAQGAWAPVVLLCLLAALVWSQLAPGDLSLGVVNVPSFWWKLGAVGLLAGSALFCGWLQGVFGWAPAEISVDPPAHQHGHGHHHGH